MVATTIFFRALYQPQAKRSIYDLEGIERYLLSRRDARENDYIMARAGVQRLAILKNLAHAARQNKTAVPWLSWNREFSGTRDKCRS